jgi:8-oxo-dGTP pyrophosphatase MutT (NUDIX family)
MKQSNIGRDEAFGIVPILEQENNRQYLLIQHHAGHWGFPKGHADPGETPLQAACREFVEETGIADYTVLEQVSFSEQYFFTRQKQKFLKTVLYYPALVRSPAVHFQKEEIQNFRWASYEEAINLMTFGGGKQVLKEVQEYLLASLS